MKTEDEECPVVEVKAKERTLHCGEQLTKTLVLAERV